MKHVIVVVLLVLTTLVIVVPGGQAISGKESAPDWGKPCNSTVGLAFTFGTDYGDNITINWSCTSGIGVRFVTNLLYINASNETIANGSVPLTSADFWFVSAGMWAGGAPYYFYFYLGPDSSTPSFNYTINITRAADIQQQRIRQLEENNTNLTNQLNNLTINWTNATGTIETRVGALAKQVANLTNVLSNLTVNITNITVNNITQINGTEFNATYLEVNISLLENQLQDLGALLDNLSAQNRTIYIV